MSKWDLMIVGGGSIGLSAAVHVLERHPRLSVAIVDAPTRPGIASRAAAGMLAPFAEFDEESPLFHLCRESLGYYPDFLTRFGLDRGSDAIALDESGMLIPASGAERGRAERIAALAGRYARAEWLEGEELFAREPALRYGRVEAACWIPGALVDARRLHQGLHVAAVRAGARFFGEPMVGMKIRNGQVESVQLGEEHLPAGRILLASGAWSERLGAMTGLAAPIVPIKGQLARFAAPENYLRHVVHTHDVYLAQRPGAGVLFGATMEDVGFREGIEGERIAGLRDRALAIAPGLARYAVAESWFGFRPRFPDGNPVIGWSTRLQNVMMATGHYRNGILLTPLTGRLVADLFDSPMAVPHVDFCRPGRFSI